MEEGSPEVRSILLNPGDILRSRYRILHSLGAGEYPLGYPKGFDIGKHYMRRNGLLWGEATSPPSPPESPLFEPFGDAESFLSSFKRDKGLARMYPANGLSHRSAYSRTYLAEDLNRFNERCLLKEFAPQLQGTHALEKAQELFEREAGIFYRLQHPQIPKFRQLFCCEQDEGHLFLVQDYVAGETYSTLLNQRIKANQKFGEAEIEQLLIDVLPILEYIHSMGVIHRDISPDNLILRSHDELTVLINFGCIKEVEIKTQSELSNATPNATIPLISTAIGKAGYAPPEQLERGIVYAHSDLYALAATAVVLLTGKEPQQLIDPNDYRWRSLEQSAVTVNPKLEWILTTMLAPNPRDRFGSAAEVSKVLQEFLRATTPQPTQVNPEPRLQRQKLMKIVRTGNLLAKSWFFVPLAAVLILGIYFCLKAANLETDNSVSHADSIENTRLPF